MLLLLDPMSLLLSLRLISSFLMLRSWLNLRLSPFPLSLLLISLELRPLTVLLLSPVPQVLPLPGRKRPITLDTPGSLPLPIAITPPGVPIAFKSSVRDALVVPSVPAPVAVPVVHPPTWIDIIIEPWNAVIIRPSPVVIVRPVPMTIP